MLKLTELLNIRSPHKVLIVCLFAATIYFYNENKLSHEREDEANRKYNDLQNKVIQIVVDEKNDLNDRAKFWQDFSILTGRINKNEENNPTSNSNRDLSIK